jgi:hypothetical protein
MDASVSERDIQNDIRALIVDQLRELHESSNDVYLAHQDGLFRGLIWALSGKDPGHYLTRDMVHLFRSAGIYYEMQDDGKVYFDEGRRPL